MIIINDKSYSFEQIEQFSLQESNNNSLAIWEKNVWDFIVFWFDNSKTSIQIKTSGSTGIPKVVSHQKRHIIASAEMTNSFFCLSESKTAICCLPVSSVGGMMMIARALVSKMNLIIQKPNSNPLQDIKSNIDFIAMTPMQVQSVFDANPSSWNFIDTVIIGGGKISKSLEKEITSIQLNAFSTFGMTETISHIALNKIGENKIYTALGNCFFNVSNDNCLQITASHLGVEKLQTNDVVNLISDKEFEWLARNDNAIETGGVKVLAEVIEQKIAHLFSVNYFISSIPDKLLNNKVILIVEGKTNKVSMNDIKELLSKFECPKEIFVLNKFLYSKNNKLLRKESVEKLLNKLD